MTIRSNHLPVIFLVILIGVTIPGPAQADPSVPIALSVETIVDRPASGDETGTVSMVLVVESGSHRGETIPLSTTQWGHPAYDIPFEEGLSLTGELILEDDGSIKDVRLHSQRRDYKLLVLFGILTLVLLAVGRWEGLVGLLSTVVTLLLLFNVFFPAIRFPGAIYPVGIVIILITIVLTVGLVMRGDRPTFPAVGSLITVFAAVLGLTIAGFHYLGLDATTARHSRLILTWLDRPTSLQPILTLGIVIGTLGALIDVAVVISSTVNEIARDAENIGIREAYRSGTQVGREILSTMLNTLVFAYLGVLFPLFLAFEIFNLSWIHFVNYDFVGIEILRICVGLMGLSLVIPVTSLFSALWCRR